MTPDPSLPATDRERLPAMLAYGLYLLAVVNGVTLLIGFIIALVRQRDARGTLYESHYRNLVTVFFVVMLFTALMLAAAAAGLFGLMAMAFRPWWEFYAWLPMPAMFVPVAVLAWFFLGLWYLWRVIGGFLRALEEKPY